MANEEMIVKVQMSLNSSDNLQHFLIYDETRAFTATGIATVEEKLVMQNRPKAFFKARLRVEKPDSRTGNATYMFELIEEVEDPGW